MDLVLPSPSSDEVVTRDVVVAPGRDPVVKPTQQSTKGARTSPASQADLAPRTVSLAPTSLPVIRATSSGKDLGSQPVGNDSALASTVAIDSAQEDGGKKANGPPRMHPWSTPHGQSENPSSAEAAPSPKAPRLRPRKRRRRRLHHLLPAWSVSLLVHVVILTALAAATFTAQDRDKKPINFDSALAGYRHGEREDMNIWADPIDMPRDQAIGSEHGGKVIDVAQSPMDAAPEGDDGGGVVVAAAFGGGTPSSTPRFRGSGKKGINERNSLPNNISIAGIHQSALNTLPVAAAAELYGKGLIAGDPVFDVQNIGAALDQLAREILRHLKDHKLTVVWLFDESSSMRDDQRSIQEKFDRVSSELK
ncbi:MAG: hypothetical protein ACP5XB_16480, partial [Isosphaeraceae bacterium]